VRETLRGLVRETLGRPLPPRQDTSLAVVRTLIAYDGLLYITPELWYLLERLTNLPIASPFLPYFRMLQPGRYLKRWRRRLTEESFSHEDALILFDQPPKPKREAFVFLELFEKQLRLITPGIALMMPDVFPPAAALMTARGF
jgi:hypothetical protein